MATGLAIVKGSTTEPNKKKRELSTTLTALEVRLRKVEIQTIMLKANHLLADVRPASTVTAVAGETWGDDNEMSRGVLDLLDYKLDQIEQAAKSILRLLGAKEEKAS